MESVYDIYKALGRAFGDPTRLLNFKKKYLTKLGTLPSYNTKGGHKVVVDWYLNLEIQLQCLLDLEQANSEDEDLSAMDLIRTMTNTLKNQEGETVRVTALQDQKGRVCL